MFQLWTIIQKFCWHSELIAFKMSWPHLCCSEIRPLQCSTQLFAHVKWIQHQGRAIQFYPVVSSPPFSDSTGISRAFIWPMRWSYFPVLLYKGPPEFVCGNTANVALSKIKATPLGFVIYWVTLQHSQVLSFSCFPFWPKTELNLTCVITCNPS